MKVKEQARKDLSEILVEAECVDESSGRIRLALIVQRMVGKGWKVSADNLLDTARGLGFPVVGNIIYGLDD